MNTNVLRVLIIRVSSLGDVVHNLPMVSDIVRHYPNALIDWVVEEAYVDLVRLNPQVRNVIPFGLRRWRKSLLSTSTRREIRGFRQALRKEQYDIVFDTQGLLKTGVVMGMARLAAGGKKVGLANGTEGSGYESISRAFHTESVRVGTRTHAVERGREVSAVALGYALNTPADFGMRMPDISPPWLPAHPYAVFFHGTAGHDKKWPLQCWKELGHFLADGHLPVLLPWGSQAEQTDAQWLAGEIPGAILLPRLSMLEAVTLAARARLAIGVDTGLTHIAAAFGRPTIELYCASPRWKTEGNWSPAIINLGEAGRPPTVEEVNSAAESLMTRDEPTA